MSIKLNDETFFQDTASSFSAWINRALLEPTLVKAQAIVCLFECERVIEQSKRGYVGPQGEQYDTCFEYLLKQVTEAWMKVEAEKPKFRLNDIVQNVHLPEVTFKITGVPPSIKIGAGEDGIPAYSYVSNFLSADGKLITGKGGVTHISPQTDMEDGRYERIDPASS